MSETPINTCAGWQPIETAPRDGSDNVLVLFDSAGTPVVRLCRWDDGAPTHWDGDNPQPRPEDVGWWSYKHSVTLEKIDWMKPVAWMPMPSVDRFIQ